MITEGVIALALSGVGVGGIGLGILAVVLSILLVIDYGKK